MQATVQAGAAGRGGPRRAVRRLAALRFAALAGLMALGLLGLASCGSDRQYGRAPGLLDTERDEFVILPQPPLTVPPDFKRGAGRAEVRRFSDTAAETARASLVGKRGSAPTGGEDEAFLRLVQAQYRNPVIRQDMAYEGVFPFPVSPDFWELLSDPAYFGSGVLAGLEIVYERTTGTSTPR